MAIFCHYCGSERLDGVRYCRKCGQDPKPKRRARYCVTCGIRLRLKEKDVCLGCATKTDRIDHIQPLGGNMLDWVLSDYRITMSVLALPVVVIVTSLAVGEIKTALAVAGGLALIFTIYEISNRRH